MLYLRWALVVLFFTSVGLEYQSKTFFVACSAFAIGFRFADTRPVPDDRRDRD